MKNAIATRTATHWLARGCSIPLDKKPVFMGIANLTPDSFSERPLFAQRVPQQAGCDAGKECDYFPATPHLDPYSQQAGCDAGKECDGNACRNDSFEVDENAVVEYALNLIRAGAGMIDLGAESTSPGSLPVPPQEQIRRLLPSVKRLTRLTHRPISIDTTSSLVAREMLEAGAMIINDISGGTFDPEMIDVVQHYQAGVCLGHIQGRPQTMQAFPRYDHVIAEVREYLASRRDEFMSKGVPGPAIAIDPGIGFGKTQEHNFEILRHANEFRIGDSVLLFGHSRKRFLRSFCSPSPSVEELDALTALVSAHLAAKGVDVLRVHRIEPHHAAIALCTELTL
ncbi:MAG: dihydropteroate synthase [Thermoguttaceae bacterium]|nr:dihydropteroate synthase [Thermoguttaceae bacterium]